MALHLKYQVSDKKPLRKQGDGENNLDDIRSRSAERKFAC